MKTSKLILYISLLVCFFFVVPVHSASIKERMKSRIPAINTLKDQEKIGENNKGFLEYRTNEKPQQKVIASENEDRATVYKAIGKKQGASAKLVGQRRAKMIAEKGKAGHWFQDSSGKWYKK